MECLDHLFLAQVAQLLCTFFLDMFGPIGVEDTGLIKLTCVKDTLLDTVVFVHLDLLNTLLCMTPC